MSTHGGGAALEEQHSENADSRLVFRPVPQPGMCSPPGAPLVRAPKGFDESAAAVDQAGISVEIKCRR